MTKLVKILTGEHAGNIAHITSQALQLGLMNVTPIYGDPLVSVQLRTSQVEFIHGYWFCDKCEAKGITTHRHAGCNYGATFYKR